MREHLMEEGIEDENLGQDQASTEEETDQLHDQTREGTCAYSSRLL